MESDKDISDSNTENSDRESAENAVNASSRKRKSYGRSSDVMKKMRLCTHEIGPDCECKRLKCFQVISKDNAKKIIKGFNELSSYNEQSLYLTGLITLHNVKNRRPRKNEHDAKLHENVFTYKVRICDNNLVKEIPVCYKAFLSLHGVSAKRIQNIQKSLKVTGKAPVDKRGTYDHKHCRTSPDVEANVFSHINSFKGRQSHYSLNKTRKIYLPESLNVKKMYELYLAGNHPHVSYEYYRKIFVTKFNLGFGYPRSDTCSTCDRYQAEVKLINCKLQKIMIEGECKVKLLEELSKLEIENQVHQKKAQTFYDKKKIAKLDSRKRRDKETVTMDFQKNMSLPNISTNDVYYRRQLSFYMFNIHILSTGDSVFYCYTEEMGSKGADEVTSMLNHFIFYVLDPQVRHLEIFCDSCSGQNKNYLVIKFCHYIVAIVKRLESIKITFPIRGHSYMECDRNMAVINQKSACEVPEDWINVVQNARVKPSPFQVFSLDYTFFRNWNSFLEPHYMKKNPIATRPVREFLFQSEHNRSLEHRSSFNGHWETTPIRLQQSSTPIFCPDWNRKQFFLPNPLRKGTYFLALLSYTLKLLTWFIFRA